MSENEKAALAAAEAAADALIFGDRGLPQGLAAAEAAADALLHADRGAGMGGGGVGGGGMLSPVRKPEDVLDQVRQQAAAAALLDELRTEVAKSSRLEKIISKLVGELRVSKVHAATTGLEGASQVLAAFEQIHGKLNQALADNVTAVGVLEAAVRRGFDNVAERMPAPDSHQAYKIDQACVQP